MMDDEWVDVYAMPSSEVWYIKKEGKEGTAKRVLVVTGN